MYIYIYIYVPYISRHYTSKRAPSQVKPLPEWRLSSALRPSVPVRGLEGFIGFRV